MKKSIPLSIYLLIWLVCLALMILIWWITSDLQKSSAQSLPTQSQSLPVTKPRTDAERLTTQSTPKIQIEIIPRILSKAEQEVKRRQRLKQQIWSKYRKQQQEKANYRPVFPKYSDREIHYFELQQATRGLGPSPNMMKLSPPQPPTIVHYSGGVRIE